MPVPGKNDFLTLLGTSYKLGELTFGFGDRNAHEQIFLDYSMVQYSKERSGEGLASRLLPPLLLQQAGERAHEPRVRADHD